MRKKICLILCLIILRGIPVFAQGENLIENGDFHAGKEGWTIKSSLNGAGSLSVENGTMDINVRALGDEGYSLKVFYSGFSLEPGRQYQLSFEIESSIDRLVKLHIQVQPDNDTDKHTYVEYFEDDLYLESGKPYEYSNWFKTPDDQRIEPWFDFDLGKNSGEVDSGIHNIILKKVELREITDESQKKANPLLEKVKPVSDINLNQLGYPTASSKNAVIRNAISDKFFIVSENGKRVMDGWLGKSVQNPSTGETDRLLNFDELKDPGTYHVVNGSKSSFPFQISDRVYNSLFRSVVKMFYLQRCGMDLSDVYAGAFSHQACHMEMAKLYGTDKLVDVHGGWHNDNEYSRYTVYGTKAVADLLFAYELFPIVFGDDLDIPESGNGIPDVLDEARYELEWLMRMQDPEDGGVYHKVSTIAGSALAKPDYDIAPLFLFAKSATATGDVAAVMAQAASIYQKYDAQFSQKCLDAAIAAWSWLEKTPSDGVGFVNPEGVNTDACRDSTDEDERLWAAAALYRATTDEKYADYYSENVYSRNTLSFSQTDVASYAMLSYLLIGKEKTRAETYKMAQENISRLADEYKAGSQANSYGIAMTEADYNWDSNLKVASNGIMLLLGNLFSDGEAGAISEFTPAAQRCLDYLLGENPLSMSFVTGYGTSCPEHPSHYMSALTREPMPGMLVSGPNGELEDAYAETYLKDKPAALCYADSYESASTNSPAISWNSTLVFLLAGLMSR